VGIGCATLALSMVRQAQATAIRRRHK
jgi:hypothetical protein